MEQRLSPIKLDSYQPLREVVCQFDDIAGVARHAGMFVRFAECYFHGLSPAP